MARCITLGFDFILKDNTSVTNNDRGLVGSIKREVHELSFEANVRRTDSTCAGHSIFVAFQYQSSTPTTAHFDSLSNSSLVDHEQDYARWIIFRSIQISAWVLHHQDTKAKAEA